ncbi:response regulator transcription factor [Mucilaginibacter terrae]|uniref:DNA-binding NarL/FixJ family response regulator n=1 Tax=Mucilaginibacter terrae TaxID=1955052 RepID=A0ABU3GRE0_9SPHI|nr:response regulator transcription factor [Mucilaginibacter terrae]MDT3402344.1 DNA-binding NarL/FixJ family response regulator [Mucilaginibacter terrae]
MKTKIIIFEQDKSFLSTISQILKTDPTLEVVGEFPEAAGCLEKVIRYNADIVLLDIETKGTGIDMITALNSELPHVQILVQTSADDEMMIVQCIKAGAAGYLRKADLTSKLITSISELRNGGAPISSEISRKVLNIIYRSPDLKSMQPQPENCYNLTAKEKEVLSNIVNGLSHKMIAADMRIRYDTVRNHVKKIYEKLNVASLTEVVAKAIYQEIV